MIFDFSASEVQQTLLPLFHKLKDCRSRYIINLGGSGSGKSYASHQLELFHLLHDTPGDTLVFRKNSSNLRMSCYKLFREIALMYGIEKQFKWTFSGDNRAIICPHTNKGIYFSGANDVENLKSTAGMKRVLLEEASQFTFDEFLEIGRRVRGREDIQFILILNPISEKHWVKTELLDKPEWRPYVTGFRTTYLHNPYLTAQDRLYYDTLKVANYDQYRIYALAEWGIENRESKFAYNFQEGKMTGDLQFIQGKPIYLSFDFNVEPLTCTAWQFELGKFCFCIDEFSIVNSDVTTFGNLIMQKYHNADLWMTGDASEKNKRNIYGQLDAYTQLAKVLNIGKPYIRVPNANPSVHGTRNLLNSVMISHPNFYVNRTCKGLIYDLSNVEVDSNGDIIKKNRLDLKQRADFLDTARYFMSSFMGTWFKIGG